MRCAISALWRNLGICTHAEGVESLSHLEQVRLHGYHGVKEFFYSESVPVEQLNFSLGSRIQADIVQARQP